VGGWEGGGLGGGGGPSGRGGLLHDEAIVILKGTCHSLRAHNDHRNLLSGKTYRPHGSAVSTPSAHETVRMGYQLLAGWHEWLRITARIAMISRAGTVTAHSVAVRQAEVGGGRQGKGEGCLH